MKQQTLEVINNATDVQNQIDSLIKQSAFFSKSEAQIALEAEPFLPAIEALPDFRKMRFDEAAGNERHQTQILKVNDDTYARELLSIINDAERCDLCLYIQTKDEPQWTGHRRDMNSRVAKGDHEVDDGEYDEVEFWGFDIPDDLTDEDYRL